MELDSLEMERASLIAQLARRRFAKTIEFEHFQQNFSQVCIDVTETECSTTTSTECHDYEDVDCEIEAKEICIKADATTCVDTEFALSAIRA